MADARLDLDECPRDACDRRPDRSIKTTRGATLSAANQVHERVCITPSTMETQDGLRPAFIITYHNDLEPPDFTAATDLTDDEVELSDLERRVLRVLEREGPVDAGVVAGALFDAEYAPSDVDAALADLVDAGVIEELDGEYAVD